MGYCVVGCRLRGRENRLCRKVGDRGLQFENVICGAKCVL